MPNQDSGFAGCATSLIAMNSRRRMLKTWFYRRAFFLSLVLAMAFGGPSPTPFVSAFPSAPDCPGFEAEREIILRTILEPGLISIYGFRCTPDGFSASRSFIPGHDYGVSVKRYDTEEEAEAAMGTPNSTFRNAPAVHTLETRHPGEKESLAWRQSRWVFHAGRFDDTSAKADLYVASERMHDAAVDLGLFTAAASPPSIAVPVPSTTPASSDSPIEFVMKDSYALGEPIEIGIRNNGHESYSYTWFPGCPTLRFYGAGGPSAFDTSSHCDQIVTEDIRPGEEADLGTWRQYQCVAGNFSECYQTCLVRPGRYGVVETFHKEGAKTKFVVERTFVITGADGQDTLPTVRPGRPPPTPSRNCGEASLEISVNGDALQFDQDRFRVAAGTKVVLVFNNASTINKHNWVLVKSRGIIFEWQLHLPPFFDSGDPNVIAHTKLLDPGKSGEVRFTAPPVGTYQFVCTFPGHNFSMFGDFVVTQ